MCCVETVDLPIARDRAGEHLADSMTTKYGDFLPPAFNTVGDKYVDHEKPSERDQGLNFKATVAKRGKVRVSAGQHAGSTGSLIAVLIFMISGVLF